MQQFFHLDYQDTDNPDNTLAMIAMQHATCSGLNTGDGCSYDAPHAGQTHAVDDGPHDGLHDGPHDGIGEFCTSILDHDMMAHMSFLHMQDS